MILLLDNKDSFVWNLAQAFQVLGAEVRVLRSDRAGTQDLDRATALVLSPGPGRPETAGRSVEAVRRCSGRKPILGVCLGHQAIGAAFGAAVVRTAPCHGKPWPVHHRGTGLFAGLPRPLQACRYHSLGLDPASLPAVLQIEAWTGEGQPMAVRHRSHPTYGVQFHPESFRTPDGPALLANFLREASG